MTLAAIFARDAVYDRQRLSETTAPTPVMRASKPTTKEARQELFLELQAAAYDKRIVLPEEWTYEIVTAANEYVEVADNIVTWATNMVEVGLTGNLMGMKAQSAFTDAGIYRRTTTERRRFFSRAWARDTHKQGLAWWGLDNYGTRNVPIPYRDVESPEDKLAALKAYGEAGKTFEALTAGYAKVGLELEPDWILETSQRLGVRVRPIGAAPQLPVSPAPQRRGRGRK
jgi:hypothetical protein